MLPGQVAIFGLTVFLLDRLAIRSNAAHVQESLDALKATGDMPITVDARDAMAGYEEIATAQTRPVAILFLIATMCFVPVAALLWRGSRRATASGLLLMGAFTPPYLGILVAISLSDLGSRLHGMPAESGDVLKPLILDWYTPARAATLGAAAMAWLMSAFLLARPSGTGRRAMRAPWRIPLLMAHLPLAGVNVTVLNFIAIHQAGRIAREEVRRAPADQYAGVGDVYLEQATRIAWHYAVLLVIAGVIALALAGLAWRGGVSPPLLFAQGLAGLPFLLLLLVVSAGTPLMLSGAGDEPFPEVLGSGPTWYLPAIITQTSLGAVAYLASVVLLIRGSAKEGP